MKKDSEMFDFQLGFPQQISISKLDSDTEESKPDQKTLVEWITFSISLGVVSGLLVLVGILWFGSGEKKPPHPVVQIQQESFFSQSGQFYVPFKVVNEGDETATQVQVVGELKINGSIESSGEQTIDFLAQRQIEQGVFVFRSNPRNGDLSIRVINYQKP